MKRLSIINTIALAMLSFCIASCSKDISNPTGNSNGNTGKSGSYARFSIVGNYLYSVSSNNVIVYDISDPANIKEKNTVPINGSGFDRNVETVFYYNGHLLFGTQFGMIVYSLANPESPQYVSGFSHIIGCDPVVAENDFAYVTINGATGCRGSINELHILDISNIDMPNLVKTVHMTSPRGLGIDNNILFVCDGDKLLVMKVNDPNPANPKQINSINVSGPYDVIPFNNNIILSAQDGIFQYDYSDPTNLTLNSKISVSK
ncbi:MAG: hypothetical protein M0R38_02625 [Bacteroidia bacterium]|nr:hypothetical protein [Bacteroidia bacterium]